MPFSQAQVQLNNAQTAAGGVLVDKIAAYNNATAAAKSAQEAEQAARVALDAAWTDFLAKEGSYERAVLVAPEGYTPPSG